MSIQLVLSVTKWGSGKLKERESIHSSSPSIRRGLTLGLGVGLGSSSTWPFHASGRQPAGTCFSAALRQTPNGTKSKTLASNLAVLLFLSLYHRGTYSRDILPLHFPLPSVAEREYDQDDDIVGYKIPEHGTCCACPEVTNSNTPFSFGVGSVVC